MGLEFEGRVAVVTGGSRGIGKAIVLKLASLGCTVLFTYASNDAAARECEEKSGGRAKGSRFDASDSAAVTAFFAKEVAEAGRLDYLVNNAGITRDGLLIRMKDEDWQRVLDVNLSGAFYCTRAAAKVMMKQRSGAIVSLSSIIASMGNPGQANYGASKAAIEGFTKTCARELAPRGVRVNAIAPGFIETEMTAAIPADIKEKMLAGIPLSRFGQAEEVADVCAFLLSDSARYITGQVVHVNGGLYI